MKKFFRPLSLLLVLGLVACSGRDISRAEAIEILDSIHAREVSGEIEDIKVKRLEQKIVKTVTLHRNQVTNITTESSIFAVDKNAKQFYFKGQTKITGGNKYDNFSEIWIYLKDQKIYVLSNENNVKTYQTFNVEQPVDNAFESAIAFHSMFGEYVESKHEPKVVVEVLSKLDSDTATSDVENENYKTKGDGNVTIGFTLVYKADPNIKDSFNHVYDNYLFTSYHATRQSSSSIDNTSEEENIAMAYGNAKISLPKIDDFALKEVE